MSKMSDIVAKLAGIGPDGEWHDDEVLPVADQTVTPVQPGLLNTYNEFENRLQPSPYVDVGNVPLNEQVTQKTMQDIIKGPPAQSDFVYVTPTRPIQREHLAQISA